MPLETLENGKSFLEQRTKINAAVDEINSITDGTISGDIPVTATGTTTPRTLGDRFADVVNVKDFGAANYIHGSGVFPDSGEAMQAALNSGASKVIADGVFLSSIRLEVPRGVTFEGTGVDYWDTFRPTTRLLKRTDKGTHILFIGTGARDQSIINLPNVQTPKTIGGHTFEFTHFTNQDSVNGAPATPRLFSCAVKLYENSQLRNLRVVPFFNGIDGYNDDVTLGVGDDWDVGIWCQGANEAAIHNVQSVGYWRITGILETENDGSYEQIGNPERLRVSNTLSTGIRGLIVRNSPQWEVKSNTDTTITVQYNNTWTLTSQNRFRILGNTTYYQFTGYEMDGADIKLTGVTPNLPAGVTILRSPSMGNNLNGTIYDNSFMGSFEHTDGTPSQDLPAGLPIAGSLEIDGFPLRGLKFKNTKLQAVHDELNSLLGDCRDMQWVQCQTEGGELIAYNTAQSSVAMTENFRVVSTQLNPHGLTGFTPRELFDDNRMFPTQFTDGTTRFRPSLDETDLNIESFDGQVLWQASFSDSNINHFNFDGDLLFCHNGITKGTDVYGEGYAIRRQSDSAAFLQFFPASGNGTCLANFTVGGELIATSGVRPTVNAGAESGNVLFHWSTTWTDTIRLGDTVRILEGAGSPEGVVAAGVGSLYSRTDGGAGTTLYVKESGIGNTGWVAK